MIIRPLEESDIPKLKEIYEKYYSQDFEFPNYNHPHYLCSFVVSDGENQIICAGGIKTYAEAVLLTDKSRSTKERRTALLSAFEMSIGLTKYCGYDQLHAFIKDPTWGKHIKRYGFVPSVGEALQRDL